MTIDMDKTFRNNLGTMKINTKSFLKILTIILIAGFILFYVLPDIFQSSTPDNNSTMILTTTKTDVPSVISTPLPTSASILSTTASTIKTTPLAIIGPVVTPELNIDSTQLINRDFKWSYEGSDWNLTLQIPQGLYDYYKALPRSPTSNYSIYVTHPLDDKYIEEIANKLLKTANDEGYDSFQTISFAAAFVQSLPYTSDLVTTGFDNYPRYPIETLVDNGGDCEDTAILAASLIRALGYGTVLLRFDATVDRAGHVAVGVKGGEGIYGTSWTYEGDKYYYLETTSTGWEIGEIPDSVKDCSAYVYPMVAIPVLSHNWTTEVQSTTLQLNVTVQNLGSAAAKNIYVYAGFDAGNNQCWNHQESQLFDLDINSSIVITLYMTPPSGEYTRLLVQTVYDGYSVYESYSDWYSTH